VSRRVRIRLRRSPALLLRLLGAACLAWSAWSPSALAGGELRLQSTGGYDTNVREALADSNRVGYAFLRLQAEGRVLFGGLPQRGRAEFTARALGERYDERPDEDRHQGEVAGALYFADARGARRIGVETGLRARDYRAEASRNYWRGWARVTGGLPAGPRGSLIGRFDFWTLDFRRTWQRDRSGVSIELAYEHPLVARTVISGGLELGSIRHGAQTIQADLSSVSVPPQFLVGPNRREDDLRVAHIGVRRLGRVLLRLQYAFRSQGSNSIDGEYRRHELAWLVSAGLPWSLHGQCFGNWGHTEFTNSSLDDFTVPRVGEIEAGEDDNTLAVRLSRPVLPGWTADLRLSWYRNESVAVGEYYDKTVATAGLSWELGDPSGF